MVMKSKVVEFEWAVFVLFWARRRKYDHNKENTGRNLIFSLLAFEAKRIENFLPLGIEDDALRFNKRP